MEQVQNDM